ncbi:MAG: hypothetical protein JNL57_13845 [Bacteroidetes bacterium]|nr:hypothetical protein [Bacteroidota bacterium]
MKPLLYLAAIVVVFACGAPKKSGTSAGNACRDTTAPVVFVNTHNYKMKVDLLKVSVSVQGKTITESWNSTGTHLVQGNDSLTLQLKTSGRYKAVIYGPTSTNFNGMGEIDTRDIPVKGCTRFRSEL